MKKSLMFCLFLILFSAIVFIACQKENQNPIKSPSSSQTTARFILNTASTRCRISLDSAAIYTNRFREHMQTVESKKPGGYATSYTLPIGGVMDVITAAEQQGIALKGIRTYRAIKDGHETLIYVGVDKDGKDLLPSTNSFGPIPFPVEDGSDICPPDCKGNIINVLNHSE